MAPPEVNFGETRQVIDDLAGVFMDKSDPEKVLAIQSAQNEAFQLCTEREQSYQDIIRALTTRVERAQEESVPAEPEGAHAVKMGELMGAAAASKENIEVMNMEADELRAEKGGLEEEAKGIQARRREVDATGTADVPRAKHELSLFAHISKIGWHFESQRRIAGTVSEPSTGKLQAFDLSAQMDRYEAANQLWGVIG